MIASLRFSVVAVVTASLLVACGELSGLEHEQGASKVSGLCQNQDGSPAAEVHVIFERKADRKRYLARTAQDGSFRFEALPAGSYAGIVSDMKGNGAIGDFEVLAGGDTALEPLTLIPLEKIKPAVQLKNIWFEERITDSVGDHSDVRYASDASFALSFQRLPGESKSNLVQTELATGAETTLVQGEELSGSYTSNWVAVGGDRFLLYRAYRPDEQYAETRSEHIVSFDRKTKKQAIVPLSAGSGYYVPGQPGQKCEPGYPYQTCYDVKIENRVYVMATTFVGGKLYYLQSVSRKTMKPATSGFDMEVGRMVELCAFDPASGARQCVPVNGANAYRSWSSEPIMTAKAAIVVLGPEGTFPPSPTPASGAVMITSYATMSTLEIAKAGGVSELVASADGGTVYYLDGARSQISKADVATGQETKLASSSEPLQSPALSPDEKRLALVTYGSGSTSYEIRLLDLASGAIVAKTPGTVSYQGVSVTFQPCTYKKSGVCFSADGKDYLAEKDFYTADYLKTFGKPLPAGKETLVLALHVPVDNSPPFVTEHDSSQWRMYQDSPPLESKAGSYQARPVRVKSTGFNQVFVKRSSDGLELQVTFITAQHGAVAWEDDERVVYLARDPVTGYTQLFRVNADLFFAPEKAGGN